jgi:hypothetical protein
LYASGSFGASDSVFDSNRGYSISASQSVSGLFQGSISFSIIAGENPGPTEDGNQNTSSDIISSSTGLLIGIIVGAVLLLLIAAVVGIILFGRRNYVNGSECDSGVEMKPEEDLSYTIGMIKSYDDDYTNPLSDAHAVNETEVLFVDDQEEIKSQ